MHEFGLMQSALDEALEQAAKRGAHKIERICLRVSEQSGLEPECLHLVFDSIAHGTIAEGAELMMEKQPLMCQCNACGLEFRAVDEYHCCPSCQRPSARLHSQQEIVLVNLELI